MTDTCYIVFNKKGIQRLTKNKPQLHAGEYVTRVSLEVPESYFEGAYPEAVVRLTSPAMSDTVEVRIKDAYEATFGARRHRAALKGTQED